MRVLIVDDVAVVREALRLLLSDEPSVEVIGEAGDGEEAVRLVETLTPDLVLMDIEMPRLGGLAAMRLIRRQPHPPRLVAMSIYGASDSLRASALEAGAEAYVEKGATLAEVVGALRAACMSPPEDQ
jgi:SARP family transcriptional regulator, regulator of embCAB operon